MKDPDRPGRGQRRLRQHALQRPPCRLLSDAWIDTTRRDRKDGLVGHVGYEINFNRYFCRYVPPRPLEEIEVDIQAIEKDILEMLNSMSIRQSG